MEGEAHPEAQDGVAKNSVQAGVGTRDGMSIGLLGFDLYVHGICVSPERDDSVQLMPRGYTLQVFWKIGRVL